MDIDINIEYKNKTDFKKFFKRVKGKKISVLYDVNTKPYADGIIARLADYASEIVRVEYSDCELIPDEKSCEKAYNLSVNCEYVLAVGSGTLNDMAKSVSTRLNVECGVLITAASMDGYCSKGAALMRNGFKVTDEVHTPSDVLVDLDIVCNAPRIMTASGFGDIIGKYTCLTDWRMANIVKGESVDERAFALMEEVRSVCVDSFDDLTKYTPEAIAKLVDALLTAGISMAMCGNSRPASGSEHHQSHFLEMDFARRGEKIPMHGIKVAIGTLVSIELYNYLKDNNIDFKGAKYVYKLVDDLPSVDYVKNMLIRIGCPTRFSEIGVRRETMDAMLETAYTVRDRYTVLTLVHDLGLTEKIKPIIISKYY